jgi:hypothetical protein
VPSTEIEGPLRFGKPHRTETSLGAPVTAASPVRLTVATAAPGGNDAVAPDDVVVVVELDELFPLQAATARMHTRPKRPP